VDAITGGQYPGALGESVNSTWPIPVSIGSWGGVPFVCSHLGLRQGVRDVAWARISRSGIHFLVCCGVNVQICFACWDCSHVEGMCKDLPPAPWYWQEQDLIKAKKHFSIEYCRLQTCANFQVQYANKKDSTVQFPDTTEGFHLKLNLKHISTWNIAPLLLCCLTGYHIYKELRFIPMNGHELSVCSFQIPRRYPPDIS
jgi:hypothetical protein